jgi:uncharacterized protein YjbI with pentapeptide repeats
MNIRRVIRRRVSGLTVTVIVLLAASLSVAVIGHWQEYGGLDLAALVRDYYANVSTELASIVITVLIIDRVNRARLEQREEEAYKARLIQELGNRDHSVAIDAVGELKRRQWLDEDFLRGASLGLANLHGADLRRINLQDAKLYHANLQGVNFERANLRGVDLMNADLQGAIMYHARLQNAVLYYAKLQGANLYRANLQGADLYYADLQSAHLGNADLQGANLRRSRLQGAILLGAKYDENTVLPDRTKWTPDTDMARFTDADHPDFWRADSELASESPEDDFLGG